MKQKFGITVKMPNDEANDARQQTSPQVTNEND
jgi:hypothetical protein